MELELASNNAQQQRQGVHRLALCYHLEMRLERSCIQALVEDVERRASQLSMLMVEGDRHMLIH